jgi:hypothetical protein
MALFHKFHQDSLPLFSLNFGTTILLLKCAKALKIQQYRSICLLNASFKIFTKVLTNRLTLIAHKVSQPTQTAFLPGRNIMERVIVLHETINKLHRKNKIELSSRLILKTRMIRSNGRLCGKYLK